MRLIQLFMAICSLLWCLNLYAGEIALTFDDVPRGSQAMSGEERTKAIIEALKDSNVPQAAFFVNTVRFDESGKRRVRQYEKTGHIIANHSHSHLDLDKVGPEAYLKDIDTADQMLSGEKNFKKWFRYPFLHEGNSKGVRDAVREGLDKKSYFNAYVTIDNYDWYLDRIYQQAVKEKKQVDEEALCTAYSDTLWQAIQFYDDIALKTIKRSPKHVLLLHENDVAAMCVSTLVEKIRDNGWQIIGIEDAYTDPISTEQPDVLRNNQGRIVSIAVSMGYKRPTTHPLESEKNQEQFVSDRKIFK